MYDAKTGKPVASGVGKAVVQKALKATSAQNTPTPASKHAPKKAQRSIDGISPKPRTTTNATPVAAKQKTPSTTRTAPKAAGLKTKRSTTLHRRAVKTPTLSIAAAETKAGTPAPSSTALKHNDAVRLKRVQSIEKSSAISRFGASAPSAKEEAAAVQPKAAQESRKATSQAAPKKTAQVVGTPAVKKQSTQRTTTADAPRQKKIRSTKNKNSSPLFKYMSASLAALLIAGYVAYLNVPSISMRVAANRAGFAATMPSYKPSGYSLSGPIAYSPGQVSINFASNTDDRTFTLSQKPTTWDSTALLENLVNKESEDYTTYQDRGLTIYVYGEGSAAWVNGGKLYEVSGKNSYLETDQILQIATSV